MSVHLDMLKRTVADAIKRQLGIAATWSSLVIEKIPYDSKRYKIAVALISPGPHEIRTRIYFQTYSKTTTIGKFKLYEYPGYGPGPEDEVYVTGGSIDIETYKALIGYFQAAIDPDEYQYYNVILDDSGNVITSDDGAAILF